MATQNPPSIGPETWRHVNDLLLQALDLTGDAQARFLLDLDDREPQLGRELRSLLAADTGAVVDLDRPVVELTSDGFTTSAPEPVPGTRIGHYRVSREIGRGGTGVVYLAHQVDGEIERRVAIKVLRRGMDTDDVVQRFRMERQILANLEHPNIAKLFEGGTTDDQRPYFVMEHVDGEPIDSFCDRHSLTVNERLRLFVKVCSAVDRAHRSLVIHRDLKPSNILVRGDGEPKLLDFGIAKLLDPDTYEPLQQTMTGRYVMTPEYASPEQVRGDALTTSSDVYSLGMVLFELLTGHRPYELKNRRLDGMSQVVCRQEPERPSSVVGRTCEVRTRDGQTITQTPETVSRARGEAPRRLRFRLAGDLDNIVLKALRKEPSRRYSSVRELADDIDLHLRGLPIKARLDTLTYRVGKWLRRRKTEAAALFLAAGLTVAWGFGRIEQEKRLQQERDHARNVSQFLVELFQVSDPSEARGNQVTAREILDRGVMRLDQGLDDPALRAALTQTTAQVYRNLGLYDRAETLADTAVELGRQVYGPRAAEVADALTIRATLHFDQGRLAEAEALFRQVLDIRRDVFGPSHPTTVTTLSDLAAMLERQAKYDQAEPLFRQVLERQRKLHGPDHPKVAQTLSNLGVLLQNLRDLEGAESAFRESLAIKKHQLGEDHPGVALGLNNLALLLTDKGDLEGAQETFAEALATARKVYGDEHPNVAKSLSNLAGAYQKSGRLDLAEKTYSDSLTMRRKLLGPDHPGIARDLILSARLSVERKDLQRAEQRARQAIELLPRDDMRLRPIAENLLGSCLLELGEIDEARDRLESSYQDLKTSRGLDNRSTLRAVGRLIALYEALELQEKVEEFRRLLPKEEEIP